MKKVLVIGCPGSGKSTFAKALHEKTKLPLYHLDNLFWNGNKTTVERSVFLERLNAALSGDAWIIDGHYASTLPLRLSLCDTVFFLDYSTELCLDGVRQRRGKARSDMPWFETEEDPEFVDMIKNFTHKQRPTVYQLLGEHTEKDIVIFKSRKQADDYLEDKNV